MYIRCFVAIAFPSGPCSFTGHEWFSKQFLYHLLDAKVSFSQYLTFSLKNIETVFSILAMSGIVWLTNICCCVRGYGGLILCELQENLL